MGELVADKHVRYIISVEKRKDAFESVVMEHLRMNGAYWGLTTLDLLGKLGVVDAGEVISWIMEFQHESGDMWGEVDTRFSYIALCCLSLLHRLDSINVEKAVENIVSCKNSDGGFGCIPGGESHAGQIFCCVGALAITGSLHHVDKDLLGRWLCERQVTSGGLNGRPEKLSDVCYSCLDTQNGGISDRPEDAVDVFHTYFGVAGLSLLEYPGVKAIDPAYALPVDVVNRIIFGR